MVWLKGHRTDKALPEQLFVHFGLIDTRSDTRLIPRVYFQQIASSLTRNRF